MYSKLYEKVNYTAPIDYLISKNIREYDISKANINILLFFNKISKEQYDYYYNLPKEERNETIGKVIRDDENLKKVVLEGIKEIKRMFFEANDIQDKEIISIKNDAIFILDRPMKKTKFKNIEFVNKNSYTSFYKIYKQEYYYLFDQINNIENLDVKGMNSETLKLHEEYFYEFLKVLFNTAQMCSLEETLELITTFYNRYIQLDLDINYYREFNSESNIKLKSLSKYFNYGVDHYSNDDIQDIDISYNMNLIREFSKIYTKILFNKK